MTGYKGFDRNFCCQEKQYAVGETFRHEGELKLCESGFHFCTEPLAVWQFYPPNGDSRFALVEATGRIIKSNDGSHKACTDEITIIKELSLDELIQAATIKTTSTSDFSAVSSSGENSKARGAIGCWLVLAEWKKAELVDVQAFKVDGEKILPDTFYQLFDGKPVEVQED